MNYNKKSELIPIVKAALKEDIGKRDITTELVIPEDKLASAILLAKEDCVICGLDIARLVFKIKDNKIQFKPRVSDGQFVKKGKVLARIQGRAKSILTAERVALNFLSLLSGIATKTKDYVAAVKPYKTKIMDTRKTLPGLRSLEKYAVRAGGGYNHRMRLDEMVLVKDNHLKVISRKSSVVSLKNIIDRFRKKDTKRGKIEIEVKNLKEFKEALKLNPNIIMLDNMKIKDIKKAVEIKNNLRLTTYDLRLQLEASGGVTIKNVKKIASTGVDMVSAGDLTHSVKSVNISLEVL